MSGTCMSEPMHNYYTCLECRGEPLDDPWHRTDMREHVETEREPGKADAHQVWLLCPDCGSEETEEVAQCDKCELFHALEQFEFQHNTCRRCTEQRCA